MISTARRVESGATSASFRRARRRLLGAAAAGTVIALGLFAAGVARGWPGAMHECVAAHRCYCEAVDAARIGQPGIRQRVNTVSALAFAASALGILWWGSRPRVRPVNRMNRPESLYPLGYGLVVLALAPGSAFMHAAVTRWGGVLDNVSMYLFANFLLCYALVRLGGSARVFTVGYPVLTAGFVAGYGLLAHSPWLLVAPVVLAVGAEAAVVGRGGGGDRRWLGAAVVTFGVAFGVWLTSNDGGPLCWPQSWAQGHALWHLLAAATPVLLFGYYRSATA